MSIGFIQIVIIHAIVSLFNLWLDYDALSGTLIPHDQFLSASLAEFAPIDLLKFFPSLLYWVPANSLLITGIAIGLTGMHAFPRLTCFVLYAILVSFSHCQGLVLWFPWDCLLIELLVLCAVCPKEQFVFKLVLFRVMFGFGKHKFIGADSWDDLTYTASMACWQPLGTSLGWFLTWLPDYAHIGAIFFTFFAEMIAPFLVFSDRWASMGCWSIIALMMMIQLTGHFGWFNTLTGTLAYHVMSTRESCTKFPLSVFMIVYLILSLVFLIPSQWNSPSVLYQQSLSSIVFDPLRMVSNWRILHTYGVFPPKKMPMIKPVGVFEVEHDGSWTTLEYHYQDTGSGDVRPRHAFMVAPLRFPRFDYIYGFYAASHIFSLGTRLGGPSFGDGSDYINSVARTILDGPTDVVKHLFRSLPVPQDQINQVRFRVVGLVPEQTRIGWRVDSSEIDGVWNRTNVLNLKTFVLTDSLGPHMMGLRKKSKNFKLVENIVKSFSISQLRPVIVSEFPESVNQRLFDSAVILAGSKWYESVRNWFKRVEIEYDGLNPTVHLLNRNCSHPDPSLWDLCHSMKYGGYMGCLTAAHLLPPWIHSPLCPEILIANARQRPEEAFSKIPVSDTVYWILGLLGDVS